MLNKRDLTSAYLFVGSLGGELVCTREELGEVTDETTGEVTKGYVRDIVWTHGFLPGRYEADELKQFISKDDQLELSGDIRLVKRIGRVSIGNFGEKALETGANPKYTPRPLTHAELALKKVELATKQLDAKIAQMKAVEEPDVVEAPKEPEATPEPEKTPPADPEKPVEKEGGEE